MVYVEPEVYFNIVLNWDSLLRAIFITVCENNVYTSAETDYRLSFIYSMYFEGIFEGFTNHWVTLGL